MTEGETAHASGGISTASGASDATISTEQMVRALEAEHSTGKLDLLPSMERYKRLGMLVLQAKSDVIPQSGLTFQAWFDKYCTISHQWANLCAKLAVNWLGFLEAHNWYSQAGIHEGYKTKKNSGPEYASEVIRLHARSKRALALGSEGEASEAGGTTIKRRLSAKELADALEQEKAEKLQVARELARVVSLYKATDQGEGFESQVLTAVLANAENDSSNIDAVSSVDKAPAAKPRKVPLSKRSPQDAAARTSRKYDQVVPPIVAKSASAGSQVEQPEAAQDTAQDTSQPIDPNIS